MAVPVDGEGAAVDVEVILPCQGHVLEEGEGGAGGSLCRLKGYGEVGEIGRGSARGNACRGLEQAADRAVSGGAVNSRMVAGQAAISASLRIRQSIGMSTLHDLYSNTVRHILRLHQLALRLVGVALCQQGGVGNAGPNIDMVCFAAVEGQASVHGNTTDKGTVFRLGSIPSENRQAVIPRGAMALASFKDCVFYGKLGSRCMQRPHLNRRRGFGGVRVLDRTVLNGHIRGKDCENRRIGPAAQRMTVQLQRDTLFDFYGSGLHIIVSTKGNGVPFLGGCQRRFQAGVELLSNGEGIDKSAAVGAVAVFVRGALVVAAAAAVAFAAPVVAGGVGSHVDLLAHELGGVRGIHDFVGAVVEGKALLQKLQGPVDAITVQSLREASAPQVGGAPEGNRPLKARVLSLYGQVKLFVKPLPLIENILQNQLSAGSGVEVFQCAVFHGEGAIGEISHLQALHRVLLKIQGHVLAAHIGAGHVNGFVRHVSREVEVPAAVHKEADIGFAWFCICNQVVEAVLSDKQSILIAAFLLAALETVALIIDCGVGAAAEPEGNRVRIQAVAVVGQGAVDPDELQPGLARVLGQHSQLNQIIERHVLPGVSFHHGTVFLLPLEGDEAGVAIRQVGGHVDLPGLRIRADRIHRPIVNADGRAGDGNHGGPAGLAGADLQAIGTRLYGFVCRDGKGLAVGRGRCLQAGMGAGPLQRQSRQVHIPAG